MARIKIQIEEDGTVTRETVGAIDNQQHHEAAEKAIREIRALLGGDVETSKVKGKEHVHEHTHSNGVTHSH
jgi:ribosomal protein L31E